MAIAATGTDIVECLRIAKMIEQHGETFLRRIYTDNEVAFCSARAQSTQHYAACWAGKKAVLQSLGVGFRQGMSWKDIEIRSDGNGRFRVGLGGLVKELSVAQQIQQIHISLSSSRTMATAVAILERDGPNDIPF